MNALILLVLMQFPTDVFENSGAFKKLDQSDGVTMSKRDVKGSVFAEYRAELTSPNTVEQFCVAVFEWGSTSNDGPGVTLNKLLKDEENRRVIYQQIAQPLVSRRDYAMTLARERLPDGSCRLRFRSTNDEAPPKPADFVRIEKLWGEWRFEANPAGGTKITYTLFSDPAGDIPSFIVHGALRSSTRDAALMGVKKTKQYVESPGAKL